MFSLLHSILNEKQYEKYLCNQSVLYGKDRKFTHDVSYIKQVYHYGLF